MNDTIALVHPLEQRGWHHRAACIGLDTEMFFLADGVNCPTHLKELCAACPVNRECLADGWDDKHAVRAGTTPRDRRNLRRRSAR